MNKTAFLLLFLSASLSLRAGQPDCKLTGVEIVGGKKVFSSGDKIEAVMTYEIPDTFALSAWRVIGYKPEVPTACAGVFKCNENKEDPRWSSYQILPFQWDKSCENVSPGVWKKKVSIDMANWPEGDYKLSLLALFRMREKPDVETDVYKSVPFNITIK